ncbi:MAG TPA: MarR family transcriptional regulator [Chloroflexota bacterium]
MPPGAGPASHVERFIEDIIEAQTALLVALHDRPVPTWLSLDLTVGQLKALFVLFHDGPTPIGQLGASLGLGKPAASLLVDALVQHSLVERREDPTDRRRTLAGLTPSAQVLFAEQLTGSGEQLAGWLRQLSPDDLDGLARGLQALSAVATMRLQPATTERRAS